MNFNDIHARTEPLSSVKRGSVYSHDSVAKPGQYLATVFGQGIEVTAVALTRGEALLDIADALRDLALELRQMAFEQEGAIRITPLSKGLP